MPKQLTKQSPVQITNPNPTQIPKSYQTLTPTMAPKSKPAPSPAANAAAVEDLFAALERHIHSFEYDHAVKVADQILAIDSADQDALKCKIVALIKADKIDKAIAAIEGCKNGQIDLRYYKAYCLYRQNKVQEAMNALNGLERNSMVLQLEAQILYRIGKMDACMDSYEKIQNFKIDSPDLKANIIAALIAAGRSAEVQKTMDTLKIKASSSFEIAYNTACSLIEKKKFTEAEQQLLSARRIGQEMLMDEDYAEDEIEAELAPISVQLAYIQQLLGHTQEAMEAYTDIITRNVADASSLAVATNNLIVLRGTKDISDSLKKLDRLIEKSADAKHFQLANGLDFKLLRQKEALYSNRLLLLLQANRIDQAQELASVLPDMFPESSAPVLLQAAVLVREKKFSRAEDILIQYANKFPDKSKPILLSRAQIAAAAGHFQVAAESLSKISDIQNLPATVATLVTLKERTGDSDGAAAILDSAIAWWKNAMTEGNQLEVIMQEAAAFKLKHGRDEEASYLYEELVKSHNSVEALVGLVMTAGNTNLEKAESYEKLLPPLPGLKGINVEILEKTSGAKHVEAAHMSKAELSEAAKKAKAKKRKRKPRYPKGFDPANPGPPPDPERWLPKRERSSYRPKRKDKRAAVRGSQGAVAKDKAAAAATSTSSASSASATGSRTGPGPSKGGAQAATDNQTKKAPNKSRKKSRA